MAVETFKELKKLAVQNLKAKGLASSHQHLKRLDFEFKEIEKQGANGYWVRNFNEGRRWEHNKPGLVLPYVLDMTPINPIGDVETTIAHRIEYHADFPDIDIDFLSVAREPVKKYAEEKYGKEYVCSVGLWQRYSAKLALQDTAAALGKNRHEAIAVCKDLPEEFDKMPFDQAVQEYKEFGKYAELHPDVCELAYRMVGKIKAQGKHAGGLVISSEPIKDFVPLTLCGEDGNKQWTSAWTEGMAETQLSKFGLVKFDILGLLNLSYIFNCLALVEEHQGIKIDFSDMDPRDDRAGWLTLKDGTKSKILLNDPPTLEAADKVHLDSIFQFDTEFAQSIVEKGGVKSFTDLVIYTSLGRPGPLPMIDVYIENRDSKGKGMNTHPIMQDILSQTENVLCFQEQLLRTWTELCGFTMPEAEAAQKAVKKKKGDELVTEIGPKVIKGASLHLGEEAAKALWDQMISFGRYCFNKSHAIGYIVIAYRCLWLKTHFPIEWWAATLSECPEFKFVKYIGAARTEGIKFGSIDVARPSVNYTVSDGHIVPGLTAIKGIGAATAEKIVTEYKTNGPFTGLENLVSRTSKARGTLEKLIKLGGFDKFFPNRKILWTWYQYVHDDSKDAAILRSIINHTYVWDTIEIIAERNRQADEHRRMYPKRKVPPKIDKWIPTSPRTDPKPLDWNVQLNDHDKKLAKKLALNFKQFMAVMVNEKDYTFAEKLVFEKDYLGYYWHNPLSVYKFNPKNNIEGSKTRGILDCVIEEVHIRSGARGDYKILNVTDGISIARVNVWGDEVAINDEELFQVGIGVKLKVNYQEKWRSFAMKKGELIIPLELQDEDNLQI